MPATVRRSSEAPCRHGSDFETRRGRCLGCAELGACAGPRIHCGRSAFNVAMQPLVFFQRLTVKCLEQTQVVAQSDSRS